jgi:putative glycerol-1-phosphate prenyltransferase
MNILKKIQTAEKKQLAILIDPDKAPKKHLQKICNFANKGFTDFIFVGGSLVNKSLKQTVDTIKKLTKIPVILFPGSPLQICYNVDAVLFLSLISGRNPDFLIGHHVLVAHQLKKSKIETIPTGYILIGNGKTTAVEYISNTKPIPADKPELAVATAIAGELTGKKIIYLEAGSGAHLIINKVLIEKVKKSIDVPLIVGGGINSVNKIKQVAKAGADVIVVGNYFEQNPDDIPLFYKTLKKT